MGLAHFKILIFFRLSEYGGRFGKGIVLHVLSHSLQVANFSMLLVQNSLCYVNIMNFVLRKYYEF